MAETKVLYQTQKQVLKHLDLNQFIAIKAMTRYSKDVYNIALYNVRQYFFDTKKYLSYNENWKLIKNTEARKLLGSTRTQKVRKKVNDNFCSFFALIKQKNKTKVRIPGYLDKNGFFSVINDMFTIKDGVLTIPMSKEFKSLYGEVSIKVPGNLLDKNIKIIEIVPKCNGEFFEIHYTYEVSVEELELDKTKALSIDIGITNLCTCTTNLGDNFIIDGKYLKSINQFANKQNAYLRSVLNKQGSLSSKNLNRLWTKRNHRVEDYLNKIVKYIVSYCIKNNIGNIVLGYNTDFQRNSNIGTRNNQNFVNIPVHKILEKLMHKCKIYGINFVVQEESYTSQSSFIDNDDIPVYDKDTKTKYSFSGRRIQRGLYKTKDGILINADVNGSLNILRKSRIVDFSCFNFNKLKQTIRIKVA